MVLRSCRACRGRKKYWGAGMMHEHDCKTCKGTGKEERDIDELETEAFLAAESVAVVAEVAAKVSTKAQPKTIEVQPVMKRSVSKKK